VVPKPNDTVTQSLDCRVTLPIAVSLRVLAAINLNDEAPFAAEKVGKIWTDRLLPHKFEPAELSVS
jgi:hypothetical protein